MSVQRHTSHSPRPDEPLSPVLPRHGVEPGRSSYPGSSREGPLLKARLTQLLQTRVQLPSPNLSSGRPRDVPGVQAPPTSTKRVEGSAQPIPSRGGPGVGPGRGLGGAGRSGSPWGRRRSPASVPAPRPPRQHDRHAAARGPPAAREGRRRLLSEGGCFQTCGGACGLPISSLPARCMGLCRGARPGSSALEGEGAPWPGADWTTV